MVKVRGLAGRRTAAGEIVLLAALVVCAVALGVVPSLAGGGPDQGHAVIYERSRWVAKTYTSYLDIWWQELPDGEPRLLHTISAFSEVAVLPSPDGRWLYLGYVAQDRKVLPTMTCLVAVSVPDGEVVPIATVRSHPQSGYDRFVLTFAPYWQDNHRLLLESTIGTAVFDAEHRKLIEPLPQWPPTALPKSTYRYTSMPTPEEFIRRHYAEDLRLAQQAMTDLGTQLGVNDYLRADFEPDTLEAMLARALGVTRPGVPGRSKRALPSLAFSPNRRYLARTVVLPTEEAVQRKDLKGNWRIGRKVAARLDFFDLTKGEHIRNIEYVWPGGFAEDGHPFRAAVAPEYAAPRFGDLRFSPDGRLFSYTAYDILPPHGVPAIRGAQGSVKVQGRAQHGFPHTGVYVRDTWWATNVPCENDDSRYEWLYFIPDAFNGFVVPAPARDGER